MHDLDKALSDITAMRHQMARSVEFRGYGPATLAATGALALLAAAAQALWLEHPADNIIAYLTLWIATASLSVVLIGVEMVTRSRRIHSGLAERMILSAVEQFVPAAAAGLLLTAVMMSRAPESLWMLPGLWQIVFSLGIFASCRFLPGPMPAVGAWYLAAGLICLALANGEHAFSPWAMGVPYGIGQLLVAAVLYHSAGESDERPGS
jgi:hypothetical protein